MMKIRWTRHTAIEWFINHNSGLKRCSAIDYLNHIEKINVLATAQKSKRN